MAEVTTIKSLLNVQLQTKKFPFRLRSTQDNDNANAIKMQVIWSASKTLLQANLKKRLLVNSVTLVSVGRKLTQFVIPNLYSRYCRPPLPSHHSSSVILYFTSRTSVEVTIAATLQVTVRNLPNSM